MKEILIILSILVVMPACFLFCESNPDKHQVEVTYLLKDGLYKNFDRIQEVSYNLSETQKHLIYLSDDVKEPIAPFFLNLFLPLGIGSWYQGNTTGGLIGTLGQLSGAALMFGAGSDGEDGTEIFGILGLAMFTGSYIYGLVSPFTFVTSYKNKLKSALNLAADINLNFKSICLNPKQTYNYPSLQFSIRF